MLSGSAWNLTYPHQKHPDGPGCTPCARFLTLSTTSSEVVVHGACCRMSFHLGNHPPLLQNLALGRYLGAAAHCPAPTVTSTSQEGPSTECGHCGFPVGKDYRSRRRAGLRRRKEGEGAKTSLAGGHGRPGAKCEVHVANMVDQEGIKELLAHAKESLPRLSQLWLDAGYRGEENGRGWVEKVLGWSVDLVERPRKPAPEEILKSWAEQWRQEGVKVEWEQLLPPKGFQVLPRRWVVERTFSWIDHNRRMSKDYERLTETSEAFIYVAMSRLMVKRLARS